MHQPLYTVCPTWRGIASNNNKPKKLIHARFVILRAQLSRYDNAPPGVLPEHLRYSGLSGSGTPALAILERPEVAFFQFRHTFFFLSFPESWHM